MPITKCGEIFYADYSDAFGVRRRISLQTKDFDKAQLKFEELLRRKDAIRGNGKFGMHVSKSYLTRNYPIIAKAAGVPSFLHKLRHTFASRLIQNNVDIYVISKLMGHNSITVTEIYAHLLPENFQKAVMNLPSHEETTLHLENDMQNQLK